MKLVVAIVLAAASAHADTSKSVACQACHAGDSASAPHLVNQREKYLAGELTSFKSGDRKNDVMNAIAKQLSDADIAELAAYWSKQPAGSDATVPDVIAAIKKPRMAFPKDFPKGFVLYNTETDQEKHTTQKSYANAVTLTAAKAGKPLPNGSIVFVANSGADGKVQSYTGMEVRAGWGKDMPALLQNGDWSYNVWGADRTPKADLNQAVCLACHKPVAAQSYVFTLDKIKSAK